MQIRTRRVLLSLAGLAAGLVAAEGAFWLRDRGAFPHLHLYEPDGRLGARLRPGGEQRFALHDNPVSTIVIGPHGLRGSAAPQPGGVLVVGDSQVFGLGVDEGETFTARLGAALKMPAVNAGVPTYGPPEYLAMIERWGRELKPKIVVLTINMANDLFEIDRPNRERHAIWDGWAVRREFAPQHEPLAFPGRELLMRRSHLVYAARTLLHRPSEASAGEEEEETPSEGNFKDLLGLAATPEVPRGPGSPAQQEAQRKATEAQEKLEKLATKAWPSMWKTEQARAYRETHGNPRDIIKTRRVLSESSRSPAQTVKELQKGAEIRRQIEEEIRRRANKDREGVGDSVLDALKERDRWRARLKALEGGQEPEESGPPVRAVLERASELCKQVGAKLAVLALPLDVQVSPGELRKYGVEPFDTRSTLRLNDEVLREALRVGAVAVDPFEALENTQPGAFLRGDLHLTPKGHQAVATALSRALR